MENGKLSGKHTGGKVGGLDTEDRSVSCRTVVVGDQRRQDSPEERREV